MPTVILDGIRKRCDCKQRRWSDCPHAWHFSLRHAGKQYRLSLDKIASARGQLPPRSKPEAVQLRDTLRAEIRKGEFIDPSAAPTPQASDTRLTFGDVAERYLNEDVRKPTRRPKSVTNMEYQVGVLRRTLIPAAKGTTIALGDKPMADLVSCVTSWTDVSTSRLSRHSCARRSARPTGPSITSSATSWASPLAP
jgi:hypothetical protein